MSTTAAGPLGCLISWKRRTLMKWCVPLLTDGLLMGDSSSTDLGQYGVSGRGPDEFGIHTTSCGMPPADRETSSARRASCPRRQARTSGQHRRLVETVDRVLLGSRRDRVGEVAGQAGASDDRQRRAPLGFGGVHTHSLADWDGTARDASFQTLIRQIRKRLGDSAAGGATPPPFPPPSKPKWRRFVVPVVAVLALIIAVAIIQPYQSPPDPGAPSQTSSPVPASTRHGE